LNWVHSNQKGEEKPFLPEPYNWKTYGDMNVEFWKKHQNTSLEDATKMFHQSHRDVLELAEKFTSEDTESLILDKKGTVAEENATEETDTATNSIKINIKL